MHPAVGEAAGRRVGDRVGDQDRVGDAVDGKVAAGGQGADDPRQDRGEQLGAADGDLGARRSRSRPASRAVRRPRRRRPAGAAAFRPRCRGRGRPRSEKLLESAAISERPRRRLDGSASGRGRIPTPESRTTTVRPSDRRLRLDAERPGLAFVGVDDDVHAGLGDDGLQVGDPGLVHADLLGQAGQGVADHGDVLRASRKRHLEPCGLLAAGGRLCHWTAIFCRGACPQPAPSISADFKAFRYPPCTWVANPQRSR